LDVSGTSNFEKFVPKSHYEKWKKTYLATYIFVMVIAVVLLAFFGYIYAFRTNFILPMGLCTLTALALTVFLCFKLKKQFDIIKKYGVREFDI
jgi:Ca2+/H+ antiporter